MNQLALFNDITISRHRGADTSIAANDRANPVKHIWRLKVLGVIAELRQATLEDICHRLGKEKNHISPRCTELLADGKIKIVGKRKGFRLYEIEG